MASEPVQKSLYTPEQYLERERAAQFRSEYISGEILAMAGASREHNLISLNIGRRLSEQLDDRPCETYVSDMRVQSNVTGPYFYPDVSVVCDEPRFGDGGGNSLLNPTVLIEVLSPSAELYDRGEKFIYYRRIASLQEYVLVAQNTPRVEHYVLQGDFWRFTEYTGLEAVMPLETIDCSLELSSIYRKVTFLSPAAPEGS